MSVGSDKWVEYLLTLIIISIFLFPTWRLAGSIPSVRLEEILLVPFILICVVRAAVGRKTALMWGTRQNALLLFLTLIVASIFSGVALGFNASLGDLNQFVRISKYIFVYTVSVTAINLERNSYTVKKRVMRVIAGCSLALAVIVVQQYFNLWGLNSLYVSYIAPDSFETLMGGYEWPRPVGMVGNPNEVAYLFVLSSLVSSFLMVAEDEWKYGLVVLINLSCVLLTMSRTSLIALGAGLIYLYVFQGVISDNRKTLSRAAYVVMPIGIMFCLVAYFFINQELYQEIGWRFATLANFEAEASWQVRLIRWQKNWDLFMESPLFGIGPLRRADLQIAAADNEWLLLLRSYGVVGTVTLVVAMVWPHLKAEKGLQRVFLTAVFLSTAIYMIPAAVFHSLTLMPLFLVIIAMEDSSLRKISLES